MSFLELKLSQQQLKKDINYKLNYTENIHTWIDELENIAKRYEQEAKKYKKIDKEKADRYLRRAQTINSTVQYIQLDTNNWVCKQEQFKQYKYIVFKPIMIKQYTDTFFSQSTYNIIMSGSILKPKILADELGIIIDTYIETPSIVPPENRPVKKYYAGSM